MPNFITCSWYRGVRRPLHRRSYALTRAKARVQGFTPNAPSTLGAGETLLRFEDLCSLAVKPWICPEGEPPMAAAVRNVAREKLEQGQLSLGVGIRMTRSVEIAKAMAVAGFDWLFLDMEHGVMSLEACAQISTAALDAGIAPIARVPNGEYAIATRALDNGALGIVMPHVDTAAEA